jgi:hypothetical protein
MGVFLFLFKKFAITATERPLLLLDSMTAFLPSFLATFATQIFRDKKILDNSIADDGLCKLGPAARTKFFPPAQIIHATSSHLLQKQAELLLQFLFVCDFCSVRSWLVFVFSVCCG